MTLPWNVYLGVDGGSRQQLEFEELADDPIVVEKGPLADALLLFAKLGVA